MKIRETIHDCFLAAVDRAGYRDRGIALVLEKPRQKEHGDLATPIALGLAKDLKKNPMEIAEAIARAAEFPRSAVASIDVARPGYINLRFAPESLVENMLDICNGSRDDYGRSKVGRGVKCQVEYVSANPTGPLVLVSARAAAVGSVIVNLLRAAGYRAEGEYYVNDFGNQIEALGESLRYRVRERRGELGDGEELGAYPGDYLKDVAVLVSDTQAAGWEQHTDPGALYGKYAADRLLEGVKEDLAHFGVHFDNFFLESSLHPSAVEAARKLVDSRGHAYERDGAVYFRTTALGDDKDRVLVKSDGRPTYFLSDIAYHRTKLERGYDWILDILGPDHHGHIPRMKAAAKVIGAGDRWFRSLVVGWVRLLEGDTPVRMSKRAGDVILMRDLVDDVGPDVTKYFFLMRRANTPLDFDLELARKQSDENPVYYVQYAHARIASVVRFAAEKQVKRGDGATALADLTSPEERDLLVHLMFFPYVVEGAALAQEPHRLPTYARELATLFHQLYHQHRIVTDDADLSGSRLLLAEATRQVLRNALHLMGVGAPSSM